MAATHYSPIHATEEIEDPVTYEEASALLERTGHPAPVSTLRRYVRDDELPTIRRGPKGQVCVSWSDILDAHFKRTAVRLRTSSNWP